MSLPSSMPCVSSALTIPFKNALRALGKLHENWIWSAVSVVVALLWLVSVPMEAQTTSVPTELKFMPIAAYAFGDAPFKVAATSASSGEVTYTVLSGPATLSGSMLTITGGGVVQLSAKQAANGTYGAMTAQTSFPVSTATSQTMKFDKIGSVVSSAIASDTPNFLFVDSDGRFFLQNADSQYDTVPANHVWEFYIGANAQDPGLKLSPGNSQFDTQKMCETGNPAYSSLWCSGDNTGKWWVRRW